jgi:hypothetical protein
MRRMYPLLAAALLALILAGCGSNASSGGITDVQNAHPESPAASTSSQSLEPSDSLASSTEASPSSAESASPSAAADPASTSTGMTIQEAADQVIEILRDRDLDSLQSWIDPVQGLRFSPYPHIDTKTDLVFQADKLPDFKDATKLTWGTADGSGEPIVLSFRDYYEKYVYNQDFQEAPKVSVNALVGVGNMVFNAKDVYPGASFVEYHFPGFDKKNEGMDWQSLVLILQPSTDPAGEWKLAAIVHGQWTI